MLVGWTRLRRNRTATGRRAAALGTIVAAALSGIAGPAAAASPPAKLAVCLACHGANGQSQIAGVPSLGGQPSKYLVIQLYMFREGLRPIAPMNTLMKGWSDEELQQAADYLATLPAPKPPADAGEPARLAKAKALTEQAHCNVCHRADFTGQENVPHLADQREDYLAKALSEYKSGARKGYEPTMAEALQPVDAAQLPDLAYYLSRFRPPARH
jgi:cytochrome c553